MSKLALPKGKTVSRPNREPDYYSKRDVPYWWAPEWVRGSGKGYGRIIFDSKDEGLHMLSKKGNSTWILGSIQYEFQEWHEENEIDYILLGMDYSDLNLDDWEYE